MLIVEILFAICALSWISGVVYLLIGHPKSIYHDILGWHKPNDCKNIWNDGCSFHCTCKYCGKEIMQDSQGNWFTF